MSAQRLAVAGAGAIAVALGAWWLATGPLGGADAPADAPTAAEPRAADAPTAAAAPGSPWRWDDGRAHIYALTWRHSGVADAAGFGDDGSRQEVDGALLIEGELRVAVVSRGGDGVTLELSLPTLDTLAWRALGVEVPSEEAIARYFAGRRAFLRVDAAGRAGELSFPPDTPRSFAQAVAPLVRQAWPEPPPGDLAAAGATPVAWTRVAPTGLGVAETRWEAAPGGEGDPWEIALTATRVAADYDEQHLVRGGQPIDGMVGAGKGRFEVAAGRLEAVETQEHLEVLRGGERVAIAHVSLSLRYLRGEPVADLADARGAVPLGALPNTARDNALDKRAGDMSLARIADDLLRFGEGGVMPRHNAWLWQVTGWLHRDPTRAGALAELFHRPGLGRAGQALIIDLLVAVGHPEAQAALRGLLGDDDLAGRDDYGQLLQRVALISRPEPETAALAARRYDERAGDDVGRSAAVALGAMAGRGVKGADGIVGRLTADLRGASAVDDERALLRALGNSRSPLAEGAITARLDDARPLIRAEAARALSRWESPGARARLAQAVAEEADPISQKWALAALAEREPGLAGVVALEALARSGRLDGGNVYEALRLVERAEATLGADAVWPAALALREARVGDRAARSRVNSWVEELRARL